MNRIHLLLIAIANILYFNSVPAQSVNSRFERITIKDGLSQSTINCIMQDRKGFMWFGTYGGLNRYDGYSFKVFGHDENDSTSLNNDGVIYLCEDNEGYIWVVNNGKAGLNRYDPMTEKFTGYTNDPDDSTSISSNEIRSVTQDKEGNIWICAKNALNLVVQDKNNPNAKIRFKRFYPSGDSIELKMIYEDSKGNLLLIGNRIYYFDRKTHKFTNSGILVASSEIKSVCEDKAGNLYIGSQIEGIMKLVWNSNTKRYVLTDPDKINVTPTSSVYLVIDNKEQMWMGTEANGLYRYDPHKEELENYVADELNANSISDNKICSEYIDRSGNLWLGTYSQGLCKYDLYSKEFIHFKSIPGNRNSLSGNLISSINSNNPDELWVSVQNEGGVNRFIFDGDDVSQVIHYMNDPDNENTIAGNSLLSLVQRKNGEVWVGHRGTNLSSIVPETPGSNERPHVTRYHIIGWTFTLFEDSEGTLWGGTWGNGLWKFNDATKEFSYYNNDTADKSSIGDNVVWAIGEDSYGNLWIGGHSEGLSILPASRKNNPDPEFINFKYKKDDPYSLCHNNINGFCLDKDGSMWIATVGGLSKLLTNKELLKNIDKSTRLRFISFHEKDGLSSDGVVGIVQDKEGNMWISTSNGISKFNPEDSIFSNYYESDGLQGNEFWHNAFYINSKGRVFFGGSNGFNAFYPENIKANPFLPEVVFTDLKILNRPVHVDEKVNNQTILTSPVSETKDIVLSHKNNVITFEFSALHYTQPLSNQYAYLLEGFDNDWNYSGNQRTATYTNLNPGKYVFRVKGTNSDGNWSEKEATIRIKVLPPWWRIWWFRILVIGTVIFVIYRIIKIRFKAEKQSKSILEAKIKEGELELKKKMDEIEQHKQEILEKENAAMETNWFNKGMTIFSEIISKNSKDLNVMASKFIHALIDYLGIEIGAFYVLDKRDDNSPVFEMIGSSSMSTERMRKDIAVEEGYLGACYTDKKKIIVNNLPDNFIKLESGLGSISLKNLCLVPLIYENEIKGIIEIASLDGLPDYKIDLLDKLAENLASSIEMVQVSERMKTVVGELNSHIEEMNAQEEELRQNMEEMLATQEESERIREAQTEIEDKLHSQNEVLKNTKDELRQLYSEHNELLEKYNALIDGKKN